MFISFFQTRRPLIRTVLSQWCTHFFQNQTGIWQIILTQAADAPPLPALAGTPASMAAQRLGRQRMGQTPTASAFTATTREQVFLMRTAKAKWGKKNMSTAQNTLHCFPSPLLVSCPASYTEKQHLIHHGRKDLPFFLWLQHPNPEKKEVALEILNLRNILLVVLTEWSSPREKSFTSLHLLRSSAKDWLELCELYSCLQAIPDAPKTAQSAFLALLLSWTSSSRFVWESWVTPFQHWSAAHSVIRNWLYFP